VVNLCTAYIVALRNLPNVLMTPHQAFLTREALEEIGASVGRSVVSSASCTSCLFDEHCCQLIDKKTTKNGKI
jgi:phosphoglycerate dehydrogenase-like enzyme